MSDRQDIGRLALPIITKQFSSLPGPPRPTSQTGQPGHDWDHVWFRLNKGGTCETAEQRGQIPVSATCQTPNSQQAQDLLTDSAEGREETLDAFPTNSAL